MPVRIERSPFERAAQEGLTGPSNVDSKNKPDTTLKNSEWIDTFLSAIMQGSSVTQATNLAGVHLTLPYKRRVSDEAFRKAWYDAAEIGTELMEQEAARRAYHGTLKPVFYKGVECGYVREYSDTLMMFLLKGRRPEKYRDNIEDGNRGVTTLNVNIVNVEGDKLPPVVAILQGDQGAPVLLPSVEVVEGGDAERSE